MASVSATTSPDQLTRRFEALKRDKRCALIPYLTAGHPDRGRSLALLQGLEAAGADVVEVGVPFSDPMADGPVIQASSQVALDQGMSLDGVLDLVSRAKLSIPVVLFSYLNPLFAAGKGVLARASEAGVSGVLVTDLPVGADPDLEQWFGEGPLAFIRLVAPTTPTNRMKEIAKHGRGFVYLISRMGVTGVQDALPPDLGGTIQRLRGVTELPVCVGFGISRPTQARDVSRMADGVVVGSAVVRAAGDSVEAALTLVQQMRVAMDEPNATR